MARRPLLILHGWSGKPGDLGQLSNVLKKSGFKVLDIWLADYLSMNDEITIQDLGQAMGKALEKNKIPVKPKSFDVIVHSTGGLVIRQYLVHYFLGSPQDCPVHSLLMLAPANFGSPLAHLGKSMVGRLRLGWNWDHFMQTGTRVLDALELASPISWELAELDLFNPQNRIFTPGNLYTTVLVGTDSYDGLGGAIHENGSDGTVRVSTANLNASYTKLTFNAFDKKVKAEERERCYEPIAFGVIYNKNHGTIIRPEEGDKDFLGLIIKSLSIDTEVDYREHIKNLQNIANETFEKGSKDKEKEKKYHQYQHLVTRVKDQFGERIGDYFLEFFQEEDKGDKIIAKIQSEILEKVRPYSKDSSYRSFLFDITDLKKEILDNGKGVDMSICAAALSRNISYYDPKEYLSVVSKQNSTLLKPNTTLFVDIELPRIQAEQVFKFIKK